MANQFINIGNGLNVPATTTLYSLTAWGDARGQSVLSVPIIVDLANGGLVMPNSTGYIGTPNQDQIQFRGGATTFTHRGTDAASFTATTFETMAGVSFVMRSADSNYIGILPDPGMTTSYTVLMPIAQGTGALTNDGAGNLTWSAGGGGSGASTALDNLAAVAINTDLLFGTDQVNDIGAVGAHRPGSIYATDQVIVGPNPPFDLLTNQGPGTALWTQSPDSSAKAALWTSNGFGAIMGFFDAGGFVFGWRTSGADIAAHAMSFYNAGSDLIRITGGGSITFPGGVGSIGDGTDDPAHVYTAEVVTPVVNIHNTPTTTLTGTSGSADCSEAFRGNGYAKVVCFLANYTDTGTQTYTFPAAFGEAPYVYGTPAVVAGATVTLTTVTFTVTTQDGWLFIEGAG